MEVVGPSGIESCQKHGKDATVVYQGEVCPVCRELIDVREERDEAREICDEGVSWFMSRCRACGHRLASEADHCPQCGAAAKADWHYDEDEAYPEDCECDRCVDARAA